MSATRDRLFHTFKALLVQGIGLAMRGLRPIAEIQYLGKPPNDEAWSPVIRFLKSDDAADGTAISLSGRRTKRKGKDRSKRGDPPSGPQGSRK